MDLFRDLICRGWPALLMAQKNDKTGSLKDDWLQASWELFVEGALLQSSKHALVPYGDGADCNGASSRVLYPSRLPSHQIICVPKDNANFFNALDDKEIDFCMGPVIFDRFVSVEKCGWHAEKPPFDMVLAIHLNQEVLFKHSEVEYLLEEVETLDEKRLV